MMIKGVPGQLLKGLKKKPPVTIRVNALRIAKDALRSKLEKKGFSVEEHPVHDSALKILSQPFSIGAATEYLLGYYIVQDAASMIPATELNPKPNDLVLDMAAAPGGKTTQLSALMNNKGVIVGIDKDKKRLESVKFNAQRMGCDNIIGLNINSLEVKRLGLEFDKVLLDAPCSALGTLYKNPELLKKEPPINRLKKLQLNLIEAGISVLKPKGTLVYSTCTVSTQENEDVVNHALRQGMKLEQLKVKAGLPGLMGLDKTRRFSPITTETQGFFVAKLVKK